MIVSLDVGVLLTGRMRRLLETAILYDQLESYKEIQGFLISEFILTNPKPFLMEWIEKESKIDETV